MGFSGGGGAAGWGIGLDELELHIRMPEFKQLCLQHGVVAGIVHQPDMIFKFGVEADDQHVVVKRYRVGFEQVAAGKLANPTDGLDDIRP